MDRADTPKDMAIIVQGVVKVADRAAAQAGITAAQSPGAVNHGIMETKQGLNAVQKEIENEKAER